MPLKKRSEAERLGNKQQNFAQPLSLKWLRLIVGLPFARSNQDRKLHSN